ncbi:hypothetical protein, partial [Mesorhizobium sp.]|uniref:hypothetical protein n=1 Tax=Mesorhizobium sp. TaxID=1871066 RepID=UPI0025DDB3BD
TDPMVAPGGFLDHFNRPDVSGACRRDIVLSRISVSFKRGSDALHHAFMMPATSASLADAPLS